MKRKVFVFVLALCFVPAAVWFVAGRLTQVQAQGGGGDDWWLSSAEAPEGASLPPSSPGEGPVMVPDDLEVPKSPEGGTLASYRVVGSALKPRRSDVEYDTNTSGGCVYVTAGNSYTVWNTPVHLPQGSVVETVRMYWYDTSDGNSIGWLTAYDLYGAIAYEWSVSSLGNLGNGFADSILINHTVDNTAYSYVLNWRPSVTGPSMQLCGFRIFYDPPFFGAEFLPLIQNHTP